MGDAVSAVEHALREMFAGRVALPVRSEIRSADGHDLALFMPGELTDAGVLGQKIVAERPGNAERGLPVLTSSLTLLDPDTGLIAALMGATHLTNVRTGALTAVAARRLAPSSTHVATIVGTGGIVPMQVMALAELAQIDEIRVTGRTPSRIHKVVETCRTLDLRPDLEVVAETDVEAAVRAAGVVVTATSARQPVVDDDWIQHGATICAMGGNAPHMTELPTSVVGRADLVVVDTRAGVVGRAGDILTPISEGVLAEDEIVELADVTADDWTRPTDGLSIFKSCGFAAADLAIAARVVGVAGERGLGLDADLGQ